MAIILRKWGNSTGILLGKEVVEYLKLKEGTELFIITQEDNSFLLSTKEQKKKGINHQVFVAKWGNSLGMRIPKPALTTILAQVDDRIEAKPYDDNTMKFKKIKELPYYLAFGEDVTLKNGKVLKKGSNAMPYLTITEITDEADETNNEQ